MQLEIDHFDSGLSNSGLLYGRKNPLFSTNFVIISYLSLALSDQSDVRIVYTKMVINKCCNWFF